jgi:hypothetical protein
LDTNLGTRYPKLDRTALGTVVDATVEVAAQRMSDMITAEDTGRLRAQVASTLAATERLHQYPLTNADEPAFVLGLPGRQP